MRDLHPGNGADSLAWLRLRAQFRGWRYVAALRREGGGLLAPIVSSNEARLIVREALGEDWEGTEDQVVWQKRAAAVRIEASKPMSRGSYAGGREEGNRQAGGGSRRRRQAGVKA